MTRREYGILAACCLAACSGIPEAPRHPEGHDLLPVRSLTEQNFPTPPPLPPLEDVQADPLPVVATVEQVDELQVGMELEVYVTGEPSLTQASVRVDRDGTVFLPFLGRLLAEGRTPRKFSAELEELLRKRDILRQPQVHVAVRAQSGRQVFILGQVQSSGAHTLPFHQQTTLTQLIAMAGGLAGENTPLPADAAAIRILRETDGVRKSYRVPYLDRLIRGEFDGHDVVLEDNDIVFVPPKRLLFLMGRVRSPRGYPMSETSRLRVEEALALAGGFADGADPSAMLLIRRTGDGATTYRIPPDPTDRQGVELVPGDTVIVLPRTIKRVYLYGAVSAAGGLPLDEPDLTVTKALILSGGMSRTAAGNSVRLIRRDAEGTVQTYTVPVDDIIENGELDRDPVLQAGDIIWVPEGFF